jgi:hypothetical protein
MRVLIQNYSSPDSTEPLYFCQAFQSAGVHAGLWPANSMSAFDAFDHFKPDVFIAKYQHLTNDVIKYLSQSPNTHCVINMTGAQQEHVDALDSISENANIPFVYTNEPTDLQKLRQKGVKLASIMPGADIFLDAQAALLPDYKIDLAIVSSYDSRSRTKNIHQDFESYHYISTSAEMSEALDITAPLTNMVKLLDKYDNIVISEDGLAIPQVFFEAAMRCKSVYYQTKYESHKGQILPVLNKLLGSTGAFSYGEKTSDVTKRIKEKNTCLNRAKRLCSLLKSSEIESRIDTMIKEFTK